MKLPQAPYAHPSVTVAIMAKHFGARRAYAREALQAAAAAKSERVRKGMLRNAREWGRMARKSYAAMLEEMERENV